MLWWNSQRGLGGARLWAYPVLAITIMVDSDGRWFELRKDWIFTNHDKGARGLPTAIPDDLHAEFLKFDGNPQTLRLITKLQTNIAHLGLDLTSATLAAAIKYPVGAANRDKKNPIAKKYGYFEAERALVDGLRKETGLGEGQRHPLTWIMEACDDIAYSVLDVDDAMKKGVISPDDARSIRLATRLLPFRRRGNEPEAAGTERGLTRVIGMPGDIISE